MPPCLIVLAGLPASGKTTLARHLAQLTGAVPLRIDTIEMAMRDALDLGPDLRDVGYRVAYGLAAEMAEAGHPVICDCVNAIALTRRDWAAAAARAGVAHVGVEIYCSDPAEHRRRAEARAADLPGQRLPDWEAIQTRHYEPWEWAAIRLDTAGSRAEDSAATLLAAIRAALANHP